MDIHNGVAQKERDIVVVQALHDVALESAGVRQKLGHALDVRALKRHAARHDETDVARAENDDAPADHVALDIKVALCGAGGENAERTTEMWKEIPARSKDR